VRVELDPAAADSYANVPLAVAERCDTIMDWIEQDDPARRHKPRRFADGEWLVTFWVLGVQWVVWEEDGGMAAVRHIGEVTSLGD